MCIATGGDTKKAPAFLCKCLNHKGLSRPFPWSHLGLNQGPPDYESGATNQLSYGTVFRFFYFITGSCRASSFLTTARLLRQSSLAFLVLPQNKLQALLYIRWGQVSFALHILGTNYLLHLIPSKRSNNILKIFFPFLPILYPIR